MKLDFKDIPAKLAPALQVVRKYLTLIFILSFMFAYVFLVFRINSLARREPTDDAVTEELKTVQRPKLDQSAVDKIEDLQAQNIDVKALFEEARRNPFDEQ